jgi:hypothetical protein
MTAGKQAFAGPNARVSRRRIALVLRSCSARAPGCAKRETEAKRICARCPVKSPCLAYALGVHEALGIWGGSTEAERRQLYRAVQRRMRDGPLGTDAASAR